MEFLNEEKNINIKKEFKDTISSERVNKDMHESDTKDITNLVSFHDEKQKDDNLMINEPNERLYDSQSFTSPLLKDEFPDITKNFNKNEITCKEL